jgi:hypothetical protein
MFLSPILRLLPLVAITNTARLMLGPTTVARKIRSVAGPAWSTNICGSISWSTWPADVTGPIRTGSVSSSWS